MPRNRYGAFLLSIVKYIVANLFDLTSWRARLPFPIGYTKKHRNDHYY